MSAKRNVQQVRDELSFLRVVDPHNAKVKVLAAELTEMNRTERERRAARKAIRDGILKATHVRLADGWVEIVTVDAPEHEVVVAIGANREERVPVSKVLEVMSL
jgi:hypothetical protein